MGFIGSLLGKKKNSPKDLVSNKQIELVQNSFTLITPHRGQVSELFFSKLFKIDSSLESSLMVDPKDQERRLIPMLSAVVNGLVDFELIIPILQDFGRTHVEYNIQEKHYEAVQKALFYALQTVLQEKWTSEVDDAWSNIFSVLTNIMKEAANEIEKAS
ncbi:globin domain-containing protein [Flammeovirga sp. SJP92]|uniref:globin domain-containing protein n=1 Tax=Flammeovirga sp. SJP92 TaxID=1775430 RepID=UPI0007886F7A|nr:globin domain-containing protein [Flammeovirga sp. SJP92]KXX72313.1 hypothetical protein AVL50_01545 [Flammeovirga sp. SJP92]